MSPPLGPPQTVVSRREWETGACLDQGSGVQNTSFWTQKMLIGSICEIITGPLILSRVKLKPREGQGLA